jgi:hypothetical protein
VSNNDKERETVLTVSTFGYNAVGVESEKTVNRHIEKPFKTVS